MKFEFSMVIFYCSCLLGKYYPPQLGVAPETKDLAVVPQGKCKLYRTPGNFHVGKFLRILQIEAQSQKFLSQKFM